MYIRLANLNNKMEREEWIKKSGFDSWEDFVTTIELDDRVEKAIKLLGGEDYIDEAIVDTLIALDEEMDENIEADPYRVGVVAYIYGTPSGITYYNWKITQIYKKDNKLYVCREDLYE